MASFTLRTKTQKSYHGLHKPPDASAASLWTSYSCNTDFLLPATGPLHRYIFFLTILSSRLHILTGLQLHLDSLNKAFADFLIKIPFPSFMPSYLFLFNANHSWIFTIVWWFHISSPFNHESHGGTNDICVCSLLPSQCLEWNQTLSNLKTN